MMVVVVVEKIAVPSSYTPVYCSSVVPWANIDNNSAMPLVYPLEGTKNCEIACMYFVVQQQQHQLRGAILSSKYTPVCCGSVATRIKAD